MTQRFKLNLFYAIQFRGKYYWLCCYSKTSKTSKTMDTHIPFSTQCMQKLQVYKHQLRMHIYIHVYIHKYIKTLGIHVSTCMIIYSTCAKCKASGRSVPGCLWNTRTRGRSIFSLVVISAVETGPYVCIGIHRGIYNVQTWVHVTRVS